MPYKDPRQRTKRRRQRRRNGEVRRIDVVLYADSERDHEISDYLDSLPSGTASEFIRAAIAEKIEREITPEPAPEPAQENRASDQLEMLYQELDRQRRDSTAQLESMIAEIAALRSELQRQPAPVGAMGNQARAAAPDRPPTLPESPGAVVSGGIDMSRPRPRANPTGAKTGPHIAPAPPLEELTEADRIRLGKIMANSIKRAQPGRGN